MSIIFKITLKELIKLTGSKLALCTIKINLNTLRELRNHADTLINVYNPEAQAAYGRATQAIDKIESSLKGHGI